MKLSKPTKSNSQYKVLRMIARNEQLERFDGIFSGVLYCSFDADDLQHCKRCRNRIYIVCFSEDCFRKMEGCTSFDVYSGSSVYNTACFCMI